MNPLASSLLARRVLIVLSAIPLMVFAVGCGSSVSLPTPNNNGFSNASLNGTYVLSVSGTDITSNGSFFAIVGTIIADGQGNIKGGTVDINDFALGGTGVFTGQTVSPSTYSIASDGRGSATLVTPQKTFGLEFVLSSSTDGLISRFDGNGSGSGTLDMQGTATQGALQSLAFSLSGADSGEDSLSTVGAFSLNGAGALTGLLDMNDNRSSAETGATGSVLTGNLVLSSGTAGTAEFITSTSLGTITFDVWVIDSTHLKLIETDTTGPALSGDAFTQQTSFTAGQLVFAVGGFDIDGDPVAAGGFATTDINGNLSIGTEDYNNAGNPNSLSFSGSCNASAPFAGGRCQLNSIGFTNGASSNLQFAAYPSSGGILLLEDDSAGLLQGAAYAQTATAFTSPANYGFNLSGYNSNGPSAAEFDDIAQFNTTTALAPSVNMTGVLDENALLVQQPLTSNLSGSYIPDSPATGRGSINVPSIGNLIGTLNLQYYVVNASTVLVIDIDEAQVGVGTFEAQSTPGAGAMAGDMAQSHVVLPRPVVRPHGAQMRKK